jgi:serine/threonine protein kinase
MVSNVGKFTEERARHWFRQILVGVAHLQERGVCHRDMSLENLMVHDNCAIVIDMGMTIRLPYLSAQGTVTDKANGVQRLLVTQQFRCGKPNYMSPEIYSSVGPFDGHAVDMWAVGVILFIMLTGVPPFDTASLADGRFVMVNQGRLQDMLISWGMPVSGDAGDLLQNMLWQDPNRRLSLAQVSQHRWTLNPNVDSP